MRRVTVILHPGADEDTVMEPKLSSIFALALTIAAAVCCQAATPERLSDDVLAAKDRGIKVTYVGAVLEYEPYVDWKDGGEEIVRENSRIIAEYAAEAKTKGADILVAPEYGLTGLDMHFLQPEEMFSLMQYVPDPGLGVVPCTTPVDPANVVAVRNLSCSAVENKMYIVVGVAEASPCSPDVRNPYNNAMDTSRDCPKSGYIHYNTQVVFDRNGVVIARYRKKNLFVEPSFYPGLEPDESALFTTDFNVTFTLQICFDIAFLHPGWFNVLKYSVHDVAMSTAWIDILPFYLATSVQNAWSRDMGVNLLVSGYHSPENSKLGSGIYRGLTDREVTYVADVDSGSRLLISEVDTFASEEEHFLGGSRREHGRSNRSHKPFDAEEHGSRRQKPFDAEEHGSRIQKPFDAEEHGGRSQNRHHAIYFDDVSKYANVPLVHDGDALQQAEACHADGLCCELSYYPTGKLNYSLVAYSGPVLGDLPSFHIYSQICAVLWCQTNDVRTCTHVEEGLPESDTFGAFELSCSFDTICVYPTLVYRNFSLAENSLYSVSSYPKLTVSTEGPVSDLLVAGLYGRWYSRDDGWGNSSFC
ncbi:pantetheinase-like [Macrobrachium rosenbergii]|uniref:pantetheinase-like n=1 Tax=Macrobrachium rosenbergii TaxID=79674 RepID=UPI0034D67046